MSSRAPLRFAGLRFAGNGSGDGVGENALWWSARATDELGASSEWAPAWSFHIAQEPAAPPGPDTITTGGAACDCESNVAGLAAGTGPAMLLLGLVGVAFRRRRPRPTRPVCS